MLDLSLVFRIPIMKTRDGLLSDIIGISTLIRLHLHIETTPGSVQACDVSFTMVYQAPMSADDNL